MLPTFALWAVWRLRDIGGGGSGRGGGGDLRLTRHIRFHARLFSEFPRRSGGTKTEHRSVNTGTCIPELVPLSETAKAAAIQRRQDIIDGTVAHPWDASGFDDGGDEEAPQAAPAVAAPEPEPEANPTGWASMSWL